MKLKQVIKLYLGMVFFVSGLLAFAPSHTEASSTYSAKTKTSVNVRAKTTTSSKKLGTLKKGITVVVYNQTKSGWSEIRYKKKKAYVSSTYLTVVPTKPTVSYLPNTKKMYTYRELNDMYDEDYEFKWTERYLRKNGNQYVWQIRETYTFQSIIVDNKREFTLSENSNGLRKIYDDGFQVYLLKYPIKKGGKWTDSNDVVYTISDTNATVKTPAGTFKKAVVVKSSRGYQEVYAPGVGLIKSESFESQSEYIHELFKLTNR